MSGESSMSDFKPENQILSGIKNISIKHKPTNEDFTIKKCRVKENNPSYSPNEIYFANNFDDTFDTVPEIQFSARKKYLKENLSQLLDLREKSVEDNGNPDSDRKIFCCTGCSKRFRYFEELHAHITRATCQLMFRCQTCFIIFEVINICQVILHVRQHRDIAGKHPLNIGFELVAAAPMDENIQLSEVCPECRQEVGCVVSHLWKTKPTKPNIQCTCCNIFVTRNVCRYNLHIRLHKHMAPYICPDCAKVFKKMSDLKFHLQAVCRHSDEFIRYKCSVCGMITGSCTDLLSHVFTDHNPLKYKCHLCGEIMNLASEKNAHYNENHQKDMLPITLRRIRSYVSSHKCLICGEENLRGTLYERHVKLHFKGATFQVNTFMCECGFITMFKGTYLSHKSTACINFEFAPLKFSPARLKTCKICCDIKYFNNSDPFVCESCEMLTAETELRYKCSLCNNILEYSMGKVMIHLHNVHNRLTEDFPYSLVEKIRANPNFTNTNSTASSASSESLNSLEKEQISEDSSQECAIISESSSANAFAQKNIVSDASIKCRICSATFVEKDRLRFHYAVVHFQSTEGFHCLECGETCNTANALSAHLKSHGIINTEAYVKKYYKEEVSSSDNSTDMNNESNELFSCPECSEQFSHSTEYHKHLRSHGMAFLKRMKQM